MPIKLPNSTNMNSEKMKGKYLRPSVPTLSRIILATNSYISSAIDCQRPGTRARPLTDRVRKAVDRITATTIHSEELVKETFTPPISSGIRGSILNCSTGLAKTRLAQLYNFY